MFKNLIGKKNLSIDRLASLCHIAEAGSISAATGDDANRQSLFSRQIKELQTFLGIELLDRHSKPYRLTEQGLQLSRICRNYLSALDEFVATCKSQPSRLVVGAGESHIQWLLIPGVLPRLRAAMPDTRIVFRNLRTEATVAALLDGKIDLGFVRRDAVPKTLKARGRFDQGYRLFMPKKFRAKLEAPVSLGDLEKYPMAVLEGSGRFRNILGSLARDAGVTLDFQTECSSSTQVAQLVSLEQCCAILPSFARSQLAPSTIDDFPLKGFETLNRTLCFAWNPKRAAIRPIVGQAAKICASA